MKLKITLYSVCLLMLLAACQQDGPTPEPSVGSRTVLVYMIARTLWHRWPRPILKR